MDAAVALLLASNGAAEVAACRKLLLKALGNLAADPTNDKFRRLRLTNPTIKAKIVDAPGAVETLVAAGFEPDGDFLVVNDSDAAAVAARARGAVAALEASAVGIALSLVLPHTATVRGVAVDAEGGIATAALDNVARLWSGGGLARELRGHTAPQRSDGGVLGIALGADVYSAARDGALIAWKKDASAMTRFVGHGEPVEGDATPRLTNAQIVSCVCVVHKGLVLTGGWDRTLIAWDVAGDDLPRRYGPFGAAINGVACLASASLGRTVAAAACGDGALYYVDPLAPPPAALGVANACVGVPARGVAASAKHDCFISASNDAAVRIWSADGTLVRGAFTGSEGYIFAIAASDDVVYCGGDDGVLFAFALPSLEPLFRVAHPAEIWAVAVFTAGPLARDVVVGCEEPFGCFVWTHDAARAAPQTASFGASASALAVVAAVDAAPPKPLEGAAAASKRAAVSAGGGQVGVASAGAVAGFDFSFPVELGQGSSALTLSWNRGDDPNVTAYSFLNTNGISSDQFDSIISFIHQAQGTAVAGSAAAAPAHQGGPSFEAQNEMIVQVMSLGVDETKARTALESTGWTSVESAINTIFG
ncbi:WD40-repeat-containing domain protein [Pelagophyceae sp. CCMP2097]|nr:WD40-repeat-containing domain protein [Pelagophyceae sp. CCMP2097]